MAVASALPAVPMPAPSWGRACGAPLVCALTAELWRLLKWSHRVADSSSLKIPFAGFSLCFGRQTKGVCWLFDVLLWQLLL